MSLLLKGLINRREMARDIGRALAIGALAAVAAIGLSAGAVEGQVGGGRVLDKAELSVRAQMPEVVILREQRVVSDQLVAGQREAVLAVRVGGNVPMRVEAISAGAEAVAVQVLDARGEWMELDRAIIVAREAKGALREVLIRVRLAEGAELPQLRAVSDR